METLVVIAMMGMIASMVIPRVASGAERAAVGALAGDLNVVRNAIVRYSIEHRGAFPGDSAAQVAAQLTQYSNLSGGTQVTRGAGFIYGPYVRTIPPCPLGPNRDSSSILIDTTNSPPVPVEASGDGWVYNPGTGEFYPNIAGIDAKAGEVLVLDVKGGDVAKLPQ